MQKKKKNFIVEGHGATLAQLKLEKIEAPNDGDAALIFEKMHPSLKIEAVYVEV